MRILDRYLTREVLTSWLGVTVVLLVILVVSRFARFLGEAASGGIPEDVVFALLGLSSIYYLILLIPPALFLAILLALGRLYRDSEMAAMGACGVGGPDIYRPLLRLAFLLAILVGLLSNLIGPWAGETAHKLRRTAQFEASVGLVEAGRFTELGGGVFYAAQVSNNGKDLKELFLYRDFVDDEGELQSDVMTAKEGEQDFDRATGQRSLILKNGFRYEGVPGTGNYRVSEFKEQGIVLYLESPEVEIDKLAFKSTADLLASRTTEDLAEIQWRIAVPVSVLLLTLLAVPLGRIRPRQGRYGKLLWGMLVYVIYYNLIGVCKLWIERGDMPVAIGMWPAHFVFLVVALWLARREGLLFKRHNRLRLQAAPGGGV